MEWDCLKLQSGRERRNEVEGILPDFLHLTMTHSSQRETLWRAAARRAMDKETATVRPGVVEPFIDAIVSQCALFSADYD